LLEVLAFNDLNCGQTVGGSDRYIAGVNAEERKHRIADSVRYQNACCHRRQNRTYQHNRSTHKHPLAPATGLQFSGRRLIRVPFSQNLTKYAPLDVQKHID
jgi:hypothetical protein